MSEEPDSLRERKKLRTRRALVAAARQLFMTQGYDRTSLEQVAAAADIHNQTLFRYFPTKAELALAQDYENADRIGELMRGLDGKLDVFDAWEEIISSFELGNATEYYEYWNAMFDVPSLQEAFNVLRHRYEDTIFEYLQRTGPKTTEAALYNRLLAGTLILQHMYVTSHYRRKREYAMLKPALIAMLELMRSQFPTRAQWRAANQASLKASKTKS